MPYSDSEWAIFKCPIQTILTIMDYLPDQADVSRCMRTCRKLFFRGERILLRRLVHVTEDNLESFCLFMRRDLDRGRFLRNISLEFTTIGGGDAQTLIATMKRASNLKKLEIAAPVLQADWRVPIALGELTSVEELKVEGYNNEMHHFLMNLYCPVRKATICFRIPDGPDTPTLDMLHSLSRFHDTLEDLSADYVTWLSIRSRPASIFPKLWALHLKDHSIRDISILENALPNLRILVDGNYLKLKESYSLGGDRSPWPLLEFLHIHPGSYLAPTVLSKVDTLRFDVSDRQKFNSLGYRAIILQTQPKRLILRTYSVDASITPALLSTPSTRIRTLAIVWSTLDSWGATSWIDHIVSQSSMRSYIQLTRYL
ncbi:hypothetical protein BDY19DRAFT_728488 [Irpex rosettiformis]|uniref:Uncharacterized protein n=1 Tax=Irpex rosettiformis TaxID=378272 RepID=A0ACB8U8R3_9APHY|nr:hypothetical protein BDY19DRAFT_728488 [Irpex rosettiformis]